MGRTVGFVGLLVAIAIGAYLFAFQTRQTVAPSAQPAKAEQQAVAELGSANFQQAVTQLEAYRAENGSYAGVALPPSFGVVVVRADASSYCLQAGSGAALQHEVGPNGSPQPGAC
jgi:putative hemolysin